VIRASIGNPYAVFVGVMILVIFSVLAYMQIPVQLKPEIEPLEYSVRTNYAGASPLEIEDQITNKLEQQLAALNNLKQITSNSSQGNSDIDLLFNDSADRGSAMLDIIQAVQRVRDLPGEADKPVISKAGSNGADVMWVAVNGTASLDQKFDLVDQVVTPALLRVDGVGGINASGGTARRIVVQPDLESMTSRGVSLSELAAALDSENIDSRGGLLSEGDREYTVRTTGKFQTLDDVRHCVVRSGPQGSATVGDIALVLDGRERVSSIVKVNGQRSLSIRVQRQSGANTVTTINGAQKVFDGFNNQFQQQGVDVQFATLYSDLHYVQEGIRLVWHDLLLGAILAALVLALFLRAGRPIVIVMVSIPISLVSVFLVLQAMHRSINIIGLAGLAFAVGLVVDDAIVALENIERHMSEFGKPPRQAALDGVQEVWSAIFSSTLVRVAVFIPIVLNITEAGLLFKDIAIAIVTSILVSLLVTMTVVPGMASLILRLDSTRKRLERTNPALHRALDIIEFQWLGLWANDAYARFTAWACRGRGAGHNLGRLALLAAVFGLFLGSLTLLPAASYLPNGSQGFIFCQAQPVVGQRAEVSSVALEPLERAALGDPRVDSVFSISGSGFNGVGVRVKPEASTPQDLTEIQDEFKKVAGTIAGFKSIFPSQRSIFRIQDKQFTLEITGPDLNTLSRLAAEVQAALANRDDITSGPGSVRSAYQEGAPELRVQLDPYRARELGLTVNQVAQLVESMVAGRKVSTFTDAGREYDLVLQGAPAVAADRDALGAVLVQTPSGQRVRLDEVASIAEATGPTRVAHYNRERNVELVVNTRPDVPTQTALDLTEREVIAPLLKNLPAGYAITFGEAADKLRTTYQSLIFQGLLAVVIIYLLLVALFRSFYYPLIVLITIPLAWSGSFAAITLAFHLTHKVVQFDVLGMLGLIILSGIVAANAILIIAQMLNFEREGLSPNEALRQSAATRLRPIMMTVLAAVFGMLPLALGQGSGSELYRSLGIVVVGGLISSTIFTLLVVPTMMSLVNDAIAGRARSKQAHD
jgi:hydrophobic/amphiphilic exporter-1 (mainly G- bacteria), HAE1 family